MVTGVDRIVIAVPQLERAVAEYQLLLGCEPLPAVANPTAPTGCCFDLNNTLVELIPRGDAARIAGLVFALAAADAPPAVLANGRGLDLRLAGDSATAARRAGARLPGCAWITWCCARQMPGRVSICLLASWASG